MSKNCSQPDAPCTAAPDLWDRWLSNTASGSAVAGMLCLVLVFAWSIAVTKLCTHRQSHKMDIIGPHTSTAPTALLKEHSSYRGLVRNRTFPLPTDVLLQLQGFLLMLKDSAVQAPLRGVKAHPHILSSDIAHLNWAVTAQRVPKSTLL